MTRRKFFAGAAAVAAASASSSRAASRRLNILLITADDLGPKLSCYGDKLADTPNIDQLASSGVRFETAYITQASCSPSRSGIFTGIFPHGNGQYGLANTGYSLHPPLRDATIPNVLKRAGYRTGIIGKLHVEPEDSFRFDYADKNNAMTRRVREVAPRAGKFFRDAGKDPFFLMVNYSDPHAFRDPKDSTKWYFPDQVDGLPEKPIPPGPQTIWPFQGIDTPTQRLNVANYYNCVLRLDTGIGMLMSELEKSGHAGDTLVIFVGDHGPPFARGKTTCYEAGLRVPFLLRWPGVSRPMVSRAMVSTVDIAPTIYDAAGVESPVAVHGRSLRSAIGAPDASWRQYLAAEFHCHGARPFYPRRAIRDQRFKLIHNLLAGRAKPSTVIDGDQAYAISRQPGYQGSDVQRAFDTFADPPEFEFYDLANDPVEFHNLAGKPEFARDQQRLQEALLAWRKQTGDPFLDRGFLDQILKEGAPAARRKG